jgi:fluoride ion exporter CrcB/FEX
VDLLFRPSTTQPKLKVRSTISDSDVAIDALPRLELRPARTVLLGFGLETVAVAVAQVQADGQPAVATASTPVDVQVRGAARREGAEEVVIAAGAARTEFVLRSSGLGKVTVQATAGAQFATTELSQRFPMGPLIATLLGGALGGLARRWVKGARPRPMLRNVLEGIVVGLAAFVAAVLGVGYLDLPAAIAATEAGAFLTGILCGFAGVTVFSALTAKLKPGTGT